MIFVAESSLTQAVSESIKKEKAFVLLKWLSSVTEHQLKGADQFVFKLIIVALL